MTTWENWLLKKERGTVRGFELTSWSCYYWLDLTGKIDLRMRSQRKIDHVDSRLAKTTVLMI